MCNKHKNARVFSFQAKNSKYFAFEAKNVLKLQRKRVPEELSYCRLSGGGALRHNPARN